MKSKMRSYKAVNSSQANKERTFYVHVLVESFCILHKNKILQLFFSLMLVLNLLLIFHQISGPCFYNTVLIKSSVKDYDQSVGDCGKRRHRKALWTLIQSSSLFYSI